MFLTKQKITERNKVNLKAIAIEPVYTMYTLIIEPVKIIITGLFGICMSFDHKKHYGKKLEGHEIRSIIEVSANECSDECRKRRDCTSGLYE